MSVKSIQIVAFDNPYPPNYGGAIDVFYKICALHALDVKIHLHFFYNDKTDISELENLCETICLYKQNRLIFKHLSFLPFSNVSRNSTELIQRLKSHDAPILFESLRTVLPLRKTNFKQKVAIRTHNIEHDYSFGLAKSETNWLKKIAHYFEGIKQRKFESIVNRADILFNISNFENVYFSKNYKPKSVFLPVFQGYKNLAAKNGYGEYALFHGDLSTADNLKSALFMVNVFRDLKHKLIIANSSIPKTIKKQIDALDNVSFAKIENQQQLKELIENAHINTLFSFQRSGTKLKVLNALYNGKHCIINKNMIDDKAILEICHIAETKEEYQQIVDLLFNKEYQLSEKKNFALQRYNDQENAKIILENLL